MQNARPDPKFLGGSTLAMVFKLLQSAHKRWRRIKGFGQLKMVVNNARCRDGEQVEHQSDRDAA